MSARLLAQRSLAPPAIHPVYLRLLGEALQRRGIEDFGAHLDRAGLPAASLGEQAEPLSLAQALACIRAARRCCDDPLLPVDWGRHVRSNVHGAVGTAVFASATVREALQTLAALMPLRSANLRLRLCESGDGLRLVYESVLPLYELADFIATVTGFALLEIMHGLLGREVRQLCFELPYAAPDWAAQREAFCPTAVRFSAPALAVRVPQALLERRLPSADAHAHAAAVRQCRLDLSRISLRISERLAAYLAEQAETFASLDQAAAHFRLSPRSLRRALQQDGESYQKVLDRVRMQAAAQLLQESALNVEAVSRRMGYRDPSNFIRAFRRYHGRTPRQYCASPV